MFTGIIEETGKIVEKKLLPDGLKLAVQAKKVLQDTKIGDSISVNGICLTVVDIKNDILYFDVSKETIKRTNLKHTKDQDLVNLERALRPSDRLGGHIVQGHVDTIGIIESFSPLQNHWELKVKIDPEFMDFVVEKGSIAIDGISLTVNYIKSSSISINIIPHTREVTNLKYRKSGDLVNIEFDIIGKYVMKIVKPYKEKRLKNLLENF